jgi:lipoprotein-anchoring transpeptidase ErfK/SrfK
VLVVAGLAASAVLAPGLPKEGGTGLPVAAAASAAPLPPAPKVLPPKPGPPPTEIATLRAPTAYSGTPGGPSSGTLDSTNPFGQQQVLAVVARQGSWLQVELPIRPNGSRAWIPAAAVALTQTHYRVAVNLEAHTVTVTNAGKVVLTTPAAVGKPSTPTPAGNTYLWELIRPDNPYGAYGPYIFGLAWFSDAYSVFNGGDAQIGIHGQDEPWSIGEAVSHGCVRLPNNVITQLASMLPLGTPVTIS